MPLVEGARLGHYVVERALGAGGMGEVYVAHDEHLRRRVAIKILNAEASAVDVQRRLRREAETIASLNHPNIVTIHAFEQDGDVAFIAMELIEGQSVRELIERRPFSIDRALAIVSQLIDAAAAAHEKGIVHRDIKPANIMVTADERVKVLDFGIAKAVDAPRQAAAATMTAWTAGSISGTGPYMSPEQTRGDTVDHRTDVFAIGVTMFEMLTGKRPFEGRTAIDVASAVLNAPVRFPSPSSKLESDVYRIIGRCVEKDPNDRYQTARDLASDVRRLKRDGVAATDDRGRLSRIALAAGVAAIIVGGAAFLFWIRPSGASSPPALIFDNPRQLTFAQGAEIAPTWSPDGTRVAYQLNLDVWVSQMNGAAINVTNSPDRDYLPAWSPDGSQIAFTSSAQGSGLFVVPAVGGAIRKVLAVDERGGFAARPTWSSDGKRIAVARYDSSRRAQLNIVSLVDGAVTVQPLTGEEGTKGQDLAWSSDGSLFAYIDATAPLPEVSTLYVHGYGAPTGTPLSDGRSLVRSPQFARDGKTVFYVSNRGGSSDLWAQPLGEDRKPSGDPIRLTTGLGLSYAAFSAEGNRLAYSRGREELSNLWRVPLKKDITASWNEAEQITFDDALIEFVDVTSDGRTLFFSSDRRGNQDIWSMPSHGGEMRQLTLDPSPDWRPTLSADGLHLAFYSYRTGRRELWRMPVDGGQPKQLTFKGQTYHPDWSPDGRRIVYSAIEDGVRRMQWINSDGGAPVVLGDAGDNYPTWSPDGTQLVFRRVLAPGQQYLLAMDDGKVLSRFKLEGSNGRPIWFDDKFIVYPSGTEIRGLDLKTGRGWRVMDLSRRPGAIGEFSLASEGRYLYFAWKTPIADIWLMDVKRP